MSALARVPMLSVLNVSNEMSENAEVEIIPIPFMHIMHSTVRITKKIFFIRFYAPLKVFKGCPLIIAIAREIQVYKKSTKIQQNQF